MSGHSRWAQIKRQKGAADAKRGTLYTKLSNVISAAVRAGGKDPSMNVRLRLLFEKARSVNMPHATIERAVQRGAGELAGAAIERVVYECYGPSGVACIVEAVTDNKNRTASEIRHIFSARGGSMGSSGSVLWMFDTKGKLEIPTPVLAGDIELAFIDAGMEESEVVDDALLLYSKPERLEALRAAVERAGIVAKDPELVFMPKKESLVTVTDEKPLVDLLAALDQCEDVTNVTTNAA